MLFFGIGFILNMLLRMSWIMAIIYPIIAILLWIRSDSLNILQMSGNVLLQTYYSRLIPLAMANILILASGWGGSTIVAGATIKALRKKGYQMF